MEEKLLLLGDQAVALGAIHAGITGVYAYPGTPSTEITEYIQTSELATLRGVHSRRSCDSNRGRSPPNSVFEISFIVYRVIRF